MSHAGSSSEPPTLHAEVPPRRVLQALLHEDLNAFIQYSFGVVRPGIIYRPNWHIVALAHKLALVETGEIKRLIITMPPRNLKSHSASVAFPAWFLGRNPSERVVAVSYSENLAKAHAADFRLVVNDPLYQQTFPGMRISRDTDRETVTTARGKRIATSIEGTLSGLGGNLVVIDDPIKQGEAFSDAVRQRVIDWYRSTLLSRPDDKKNARIVVVMQRVHTDDLVGYLLEQGGFEVLNLPAIATEDAYYDLGLGYGYVRRAGELLHSQHEPASVLAEIRRSMGTIPFSAQYQQNPIPFGGTIIKRDWLTRYKSPRAIEPSDKIIVSWDIALAETETADYSAGVVLHQRGETFNVLEVVRGRFPFGVLFQKILDVRAGYPQARLLIEDSPISRGLIQSLREQSVNVVPIRPEQDKRARLISQSDLFEGGSVRLPERASWLNEFEAELLAFPGRHDDQVDALAQGLAWARDRRNNMRAGAAPVRGHY